VSQLGRPHHHHTRGLGGGRPGRTLTPRPTRSTMPGGISQVPRSQQENAFAVASGGQWLDARRDEGAYKQVSESTLSS